MGRIRTGLVKRTGLKLIKNNPDYFTADFNSNKPKVSEKVDVATKKLRNLIAGYITKQVKKGK